MYKYVLKRLLLLIPVMIGVTFIVFGIMYLTPGSPAKIRLGEMAKPEQIEALEKEMGLDKPFIVQYANYIKKAVTGDFGRS